MLIIFQFLVIHTTLKEYVDFLFQPNYIYKMSGEKKDEMISLELMIPHDDPIGVPSTSNLITVSAHGAREGNELIQVPDNVYIISPCMDDLSWGRTYWLGGEEDQIKACNRLDYENLGGALDTRCLVDQLTPFERTALYSNKGYLSDNYSVESIRRITRKGMYGTAQNNSLIRNTTDKALMYEFPNLTRGIDMNKVFQDICDRGSNNFKTDGCTRFCVNGPGTYVKNQRYVGAYQAGERLYGAKIRYFKNTTGETVEVILKGSLNSKKKDVDPEGWKKVKKAVKEVGQELTDKVIRKTTLDDILFYYKNFGIEAFRNPTTHVSGGDKPNRQIQNREPLIVFLGDPCRADESLGLGNDEKYFIDFTSKKSDEQYTDLLNEMDGWFRDHNIFPGQSTIIKIDYLSENFNNTHYVPGLRSTGEWRNNSDESIKNMIQNNSKKRPTSLRSSTNIATDYVSMRGDNNRRFPDTNQVLLESPCTRTRPRLNEYMTDVRSKEIRIKRNITSNVIARNEIYLCEQLKKLGLGVGSRLAIVLKLSDIPELEVGKKKSRYMGYANILRPEEANNRDNIILRENNKLVENYSSIKNKYNYKYFIEKTNKLIDKRNAERLKRSRKKNKRTRKKKGIAFSYSDYVQWDCVIFTEIRGIENNALVLGIKKSHRNFIKGNESEFKLSLGSLLNKEYDIHNRNVKKFKYTNYGDLGYQSHSLFNIPPSILNYCYWDIDEKLVSFSSEEKSISREDAHNRVLSRNIKSKRYVGDPKLQNAKKNAEHDKVVREVEKGPIEDLRVNPDLYDYDAWRCNKYIEEDDGTWVPCNNINYNDEYESQCAKCELDFNVSPVKTQSRSQTARSLRTPIYIPPPRPTIRELITSGIDPESIVSNPQIAPIRELLEEDLLTAGGYKKAKKRKTRRKHKNLKRITRRKRKNN